MITVCCRIASRDINLMMKFGRESDQDTCHHCCLNLTGEAMNIDSSLYWIALFLFFYHNYVYSR